jgi:hypothetical protein
VYIVDCSVPGTSDLKCFEGELTFTRSILTNIEYQYRKILLTMYWFILNRASFHPQRTFVVASTQSDMLQYVVEGRGKSTIVIVPRKKKRTDVAFLVQNLNFLCLIFVPYNTVPGKAGPIIFLILNWQAILIRE